MNSLKVIRKYIRSHPFQIAGIVLFILYFIFYPFLRENSKIYPSLATIPLVLIAITNLYLGIVTIIIAVSLFIVFKSFMFPIPLNELITSTLFGSLGLILTTLLVGFLGKVIRKNRILIQELQHTEQELNKTIEEKELLLKEVHHRIKNNLFMITGMIRLQKRDIKKVTNFGAMLDDLIYKIDSISLVHKHLYSGDDIRETDIKPYIHDLASSIVHTQAYNKSIILTVNADSYGAPPEQAVSIGLIMTELITNSLKYAFPDQNSGNITILFEHSDNQFKLTYSDNGIGIPENISIEQSKTLGLKLVYSLTQQLAGNITFSNDNGTTFFITFPKDN